VVMRVIRQSSHHERTELDWIAKASVLCDNTPQ